MQEGLFIYSIKIKRKLNILFFTIGIILFCNSVQGCEPNSIKNDTTSQKLFVLGLRQHYGFVIIHSKDLRAIKDSYPIGTELNFNWFKMDEKSWDLCNCYPKVGFLVSFFDFDNRKILGYGYNVAGFVEAFFRAHKKTSISFRIAAGLSIETKPYDEIHNPENLSYSVPINEYSQLSLALHYQMKQKIRVNLSANYNHISNGGFKQPNKGINYPTVSLGLDYFPKPFPFKDRPKQKYRGLKQRRYDAACFYFPKKIIEHPNYFTIFGISTGVSQQIGRISAITLDAEFIWDGSVKWKMKNQFNSNKNYQQGALLLGHEFLMGRFIFNQKIGVYIYDQAKYNDPVYQRYGINFYITKQIFAGVHIKAHRHVADFIEFRLGWTFNKLSK